MKKNFLPKILILIICFFATVVSFPKATGVITRSAFAEESVETVLDMSKTKEVFSYMNVFKKYYDSAKQQLAEKNLNFPFSFEHFYEGYYSHNYSISQYTDLVISYAERYIQTQNNNETISLYDSSSSSSGDADYLLNSVANYTKTPKEAFKRKPNYNGYDGKTFDYSTIQNGDIIYETKTFLNTGHTAIISDTKHQSEYGDYVQTIEAVQPNVSFGMLDDNRMVDFGVIILRVYNASDPQKASAVSFCYGQIGKPYSLNTLRLNLSYNSYNWYCSELCYAAYNYAGIDIGMQKNKNGDEESLSLGCLPADIYNGYNTYSKCAVDSKFVDIRLIFGNRWNVMIINNTGSTAYIRYNKTMCFENDAKNWINLSNPVDTKINKNMSTVVTINENWFATDIAICTYVGTKKYITFAHNLNDNPYSMNVFYSIK